MLTSTIIPTPALILAIVLLAIAAVIIFSYFHKHRIEYQDDRIEQAVRSAFTKDRNSVTKEELTVAVKRFFHCSTKEAHYIIGVARRKQIIDIAAGQITLL